MRAGPMNPRVGVLDDDGWRELFERRRSGRDDRELLRRLLPELRRAIGSEAVVLYLDVDGDWSRELGEGSASGPERLSAVEAQDLKGALELDGGALLVQQGGDWSRAPGQLLLTLASAAHCLVLERRLKVQSFAVNYRGVELEALYDVGLAIASTLDLEELNEVVLLRAVSLLDARRGALYLIGDGHYRLQGTIGGDARSEVSLDDPAVDSLVERGGGDGAGLLPGACHLLAVPIEVEGRPRGLLVVGDKESRVGVGPFPANDLRTLGLFANQAGIALENAYLHRQAREKERLEGEMELAAEIQRRLLPERMPELPGFELAGWSRPARHVGGDYYAFVDLGEGRIGVGLGDVTGKGMPAALLVSTLDSALRLLTEDHAVDADLMRRLNRHLFESSATNQFVTLFLAELDPQSATLDYWNGGHNPALLLRADGTVERLRAGGLPIGLLARGDYRSRRVELAEGELLCLYSDGITEAASEDDEEFGEDQLADVLLDLRERDLDEIVAAIDRAVTAFAASGPQGDDQTVVLVRRSG